jgi:transcriptional regulator with XRE-family HTH domain
MTCATELERPLLGDIRPRMGQDLAQKIRTARRSLGESQAEFGERFGVTQGSVSRWESGAMPEPPVIAQLAELMGEDVRDLLGGPSDASFVNPGQRLMVRGSVAAGVWREALEWPPEEWFPYTGGAHVNVDPKRRFGLRVEGESMNEVYPPGTILDCVSIFDADVPDSGKNVVVIRKRDDLTLEATVKKYIVDESGRQWLVPRSSHPAFQSAIAVDQPEAGILETRIIAIVVGSYRPE